MEGSKPYILGCKVTIDLKEALDGALTDLSIHVAKHVTAKTLGPQLHSTG